MPRMSDADFNAHNDRVDRAYLAEREYRLSLTPERMIQEMEESPSAAKFKIFDEEFRNMMDAQIHINGAKRVEESWSKMQAAYKKWLNGK
jgi:hypothetical protein